MSTVSSTAPKPKVIPGPRAPRVLQSWLGITRPVKTRLAVRERYGPVFRKGDAIVGETFHIADRELIERILSGSPPNFASASRERSWSQLMLPPFHGEAIAHYATVIDQPAGVPAGALPRRRA